MDVTKDILLNDLNFRSGWIELDCVMDSGPLRNRPMRDAHDKFSDTVHIRGLARAVSDEQINDLLSSCDAPIETDLSMRRSGGQIWARYRNIDTARKTIHQLHQMVVGGVCLSAKFELGLDKEGNRIVDINSHHTVKRHIAFRKGVSGVGEVPTIQQLSGVSYTHKSIFCGNIEYPFPSGLYLSRVIQLTNILPASNKLLRVITGYSDDTSACGRSKASANYAKEVSEGMAMGDAVERAVRMVCGECHNIYTCHRSRLKQLAHPCRNDIPTTEEMPFRCYCGNSTDSHQSSVLTAAPSTQAVRVYVLGDGVTPLGAACVALHMWPYAEPSAASRWSFTSIDPLLSMSTADFIPIEGEHTHRTVSRSSKHMCEDAAVGVLGETVHTPPTHTHGCVNTINDNSERCFSLFPGLSQSFPLIADLHPPRVTDIPSERGGNSTRSDALSIVVACHSHAPLQEFWDRLPAPKIAVTMACCADYCTLRTTPTSSFPAVASTRSPPSATSAATTSGGCSGHFRGSSSEGAQAIRAMIDSVGGDVSPGGGDSYGSNMTEEELSSSIMPTVLLCEYDDFEVYSPKRRVQIYYSPLKL